MRLYASELCACRGAHLPRGRRYLGLEACPSCGMLRADHTVEVIRSPVRDWREDPEDGRVTPSVERGARQSRFHGRPNISMREYLAGLE